MARTYLTASDPAFNARTWQQVMDEIVSIQKGNTQTRWQSAIRDRALDSIRNRKLVETAAEHFLAVLKCGTTATNVYLRRIHNCALALNWLPWAVLPKKLWPQVKHKERRAITFEEHQKIVAREQNPATRAYYELLWQLGGSQTDIATLTAEDVDWNARTIAYRRHKTGVTSLISFGDETAAILSELPKSGLLFPALARIHERHRAKLFIKRLVSVGITGARFIHTVMLGPSEPGKPVTPSDSRCRRWVTAARPFIVPTLGKHR